MCSPTLAIAAIGTAISIAGQVQQSRAAQAQASFQAAVARNNAIIAQRAAADARLRGKVEAGKQGLRTRQFIARQRVAQAGLGQTVDVGSALDLTADAAAAGKLDELTIRGNAEREAIGFLTQAGSFTAEAQLAQLRGDAARRALPLQIAGSLVSLAGTVNDKWKPASRVPTVGEFGRGLDTRRF